VEVYEKDSNIKIRNLNVDGGASANNFLLQFQSDILNIEVIRPKFVESTALGAAFLAALGSGFCTFQDIRNFREVDNFFKPKMLEEERKKLYSGWNLAVEKSKS
jgi:glycerol kinase